MIGRGMNGRGIRRSERKMIPLSTTLPGEKDVCRKSGVRKICGCYFSASIFLPSSVRLAKSFLFQFFAQVQAGQQNIARQM